MSDSGPHRQTDYATLSLAEVRAGLEAVAREAQAAFGDLERTTTGNHIRRHAVNSRNAAA
jgi:hypothetical protein